MSKMTPCVMIFFAVVAVLITGCPDDKPTERILDWGVLDQTANVATDVASGGSFTINPRHKYIVTLRAKDPGKIKHLAVWGDGLFSCDTAQSAGGQIGTWPDLLPVSLPKREVTPNNYQSFVVLDPFVYFELSCGRHGSGGPDNSPQEFFVARRTLHIHGEETSLSGSTVTATLDLAP